MDLSIGNVGAQKTGFNSSSFTTNSIAGNKNKDKNAVAYLGNPATFINSVFGTGSHAGTQSSAIRA